jgi:hypothetical protein
MKNLFRSNRPENDLHTIAQKEENEIFRDITPTSKKFYQIYGMSCDNNIERNIENVNVYKESKLKEIKLKFVNELKLNEEDVHLVCDKRTRAIHNIIALWLNKQNTFGELFHQSLPLNHSRVFTNIVDNIIEDLKQGNQVYVNGNSFGGAIANHLAIQMQEMLNAISTDDSLKTNISKNFKISAFGSIFVAPFEKIKDINITNYLALGDVAQKLNNIPEPGPNELGTLQKINDPEAWEDIMNIFDKGEVMKTTYLIKQGNYDILRTLNVYFKRKEKEQQSSVVWIDHYLNEKERFIDRYIEKYQAEDSGTFGNTLEWGIHCCYLGLDRQTRKSFI